MIGMRWRNRAAAAVVDSCERVASNPVARQCPSLPSQLDPDKGDIWREQNRHLHPTVRHLHPIPKSL